MRKNPILLLATALLLTLSVASCDMINAVESALHVSSDPVVARVGREYLYASDVKALIPAGASAEDSVRMARDYMDSWAKGKLLIRAAEQNLSKDDLDITDAVTEFRANLLTFRYEKRYIEQHLDSIVTQEEALAVYEEFKPEFIFPYSTVKARVIRISPKSPYYDEIHNLFNTTDPNDEADLENLCRSYAEKYVDFGKAWIPAGALASELGMNLAECESELSRSRAFRKETDGANYLVYVVSRVAPGQPSPLEYNIEKIRETVIGRRKQEILSSLERDLLKTALDGGKYKIYDNE